MWRRGALLIAAGVGAASFCSGGVAAQTPAAMTSLGAWASVGSRVVVSAAIGRREGLWLGTFGSSRFRLLAGKGCGEGSAPSQVAAGPNGSWACLTAVVGNTEAFYAVDLVLADGSVRHVATAGGPIDPQGATGQQQSPVASIPQVFGDGSFLGYLHVTPAGVLQLYRITAAGHGKRVANLVGVSTVATATGGASTPAVAVAGGTLAILQANGSVAVFTTAGAPLATIPAHAASMALLANRVVVRTVTRRLVVYGLHGGLVHSWPLGAGSFSNGLAVYDGHAAYIGANKAVRVIKLTTGADRIVARSGTGWFWGGASLQAPGVVAPLTVQRGKAFSTTLRFIPTATLRKAFG